MKKKLITLISSRQKYKYSMKSIFNRGISFQLRFILVLLISLSIITTDIKFSIFDKIRVYMDTAVSFFFYLSNSPCKLLDILSQKISSHDKLEIINHMLRQELLLKNSELLKLEQYKQENIHLRKLLNSPLCKNEQKMMAQVISVINSPYNGQIIINKGNINGVYEGQPVVSNNGIIGQVIAVAKFTSRVLLICDNTHALPVQVLRNNIRVIALGNGCANDLQLEYLPISTDIQVGDVLVTSGLGGRFPSGYPVATVSSVKLDAQRAHMIIRARPTEDLKHLHYLLLLWKINDNDSPIMLGKDFNIMHRGT